MVGIDIIDLTDPLLKSRNTDTLRFISHPSDTIVGTGNPGSMFWSFWAAKESVFKARRRDVRFDPKVIPISLKRAHESRLEFVSDDYVGDVEIAPGYVIAKCSLNSHAVHFSWKRFSGADSRKAVRDFAAGEYGGMFGSTVTIGPIEKMPFILPDRIPVSFSHHGSLIAYIFPI